MEVESGDLFAVTRGVELRRSPDIGSLFGFGPSVATDSKPEYDRSYNGLVFKAVEVCGPMVAAEVVAATESFKRDYVGKTMSLNTTELELWPVTSQYLEAFDTHPIKD